MVSPLVKLLVDNTVKEKQKISKLQCEICWKYNRNVPTKITILKNIEVTRQNINCQPPWNFTLHTVTKVGKKIEIYNLSMIDDGLTYELCYCKYY